MLHELFFQNNKTAQYSVSQCQKTVAKFSLDLKLVSTLGGKVEYIGLKFMLRKYTDAKAVFTYAIIQSFGVG